MMEQMGYDFGTSTKMYGWGRKKWREYLCGLREHFEGQVEEFSANERFVRSEIERINAGVPRRFVKQSDENGMPVAVCDEDELEVLQPRRMGRSSNAVAEFWAMVERTGLDQ